MLLLRFPCIVQLLFQGRSLPFRSVIVAFQVGFPAKEYPADIAHGLRSAGLRQNRDARLLLDFGVHRPCANLPAENDSHTRFYRIALLGLAAFPPACREMVENYLLQKVQNLQPVFQPPAARTVGTVLRQSRLHRHPRHNQNSETENPLSCLECGLRGMDSKSCCCGWAENHRLLRPVGW